MKFSFQLLFMIFSTVVGTVSVAAEPCLTGVVGKYDLAACTKCATGGKGNGQCCDSIYKHSNGRDDDDVFDDKPNDGECILYGNSCDVNEGQCAPGLVCTKHYTYGGESTWCDIGPGASLPAGTMVQQLLNESSTSNDNGGHAVVFVMVGLLGAAMIAVKVVTSRHSVAIR
eukprot:CAMPEP_0170771420 /NCGR_PEP_ID=MMETSP0733-20121128/8043_1 /TAXON_ID=186038 /ORGANISM="Fragilariopsis kerguelensis, Strain L26-C5" /LENGTH=170 /DNA_ID=CAMNT_0011113165 /DNA_START=56 /DNA_END=565 /DNA_ORIENTATION=-